MGGGLLDGASSEIQSKLSNCDIPRSIAPKCDPEVGHPKGHRPLGFPQQTCWCSGNVGNLGIPLKETTSWMVAGYSMQLIPYISRADRKFGAMGFPCRWAIGVFFIG